MRVDLSALPSEWKPPEPPQKRLVAMRAASPSGAFGSMTISMLLHLGLAVAAVTLLPALSPQPAAERGGEPVLDVLVVGAAEAEAIFEGAKPVSVSLHSSVKPISVPAEPLPEPPIEHPAERSQTDSKPEPEPSRPLPVKDEPATEAAHVEPAPPPAEPPQPAEKAKAPAAHAQKRAIRKSETPPHRPKAEARGRQGEGRATASRPAQSRGGTGGRADVAGYAAITSVRARLIAHLNRYKIYPEQAQERGLTGRNAVTLTLSRDGHVLSAALSGPSGHALLDSATLAAVRRAQPFPAIPEGVPPNVTVTIGLNYQLQ
jgi:protein TonB